MWRSTAATERDRALSDCRTDETYANPARSCRDHALTDLDPAAMDTSTALIHRPNGATVANPAGTYRSTLRIVDDHDRRLTSTAHHSPHIGDPLSSTAGCGCCTAHTSRNPGHADVDNAHPYRSTDYPSLSTDHLSLDTDDADHVTARGMTASASSEHFHRDANALPHHSFISRGHRTDAHGGRFHFASIPIRSPVRRRRWMERQSKLAGGSPCKFAYRP